MLSQINITEENKTQLSGIECFSCCDSLTAEGREIVAHNSVNGLRHPFHKSCILEYAFFHKKNILCCPTCQEELNIRSLFSWAELTRLSAGRFVWHAIPASLSAAVAATAGLISLAATERITAEPILKEGASIAGISHILVAVGALFGEIAFRIEPTPAFTLLSTVQACIAFTHNPINAGPMIAHMIGGNGMVATGVVAGAIAGVISEIAIKHLGKNLPAIKQGVETGICAGLILLAGSHSKPVILATITTIAGIASGILSINY